MEITEIILFKLLAIKVKTTITTTTAVAAAAATIYTG